MSYVPFLILGGAIFIVILAGLRSAAKKRREGSPLPDNRMARAEPSADAPTPAKSVVETPAQVEQARKHTPPA